MNFTAHKAITAFLAILLLAACMRSPDCFDDGIFCAALVTDTLGVNDHGINQDTWAGLENSKADGMVDRIEFIESVDTRDYEKNIEYFAKNGFDVIITVGAGMRDETLHAADLFPDSVFIGIDQAQEETRPNLIPITFAEDQMGFFAGALAAHLSKTRMVAAICETSGIDSMWRYCEGFRAGAHYVDKDLKVLVEYRDTGASERLFIDEAWGMERAQYFIRRGVDVVFAAGGATGQGALRAASKAGIMAIGTERDQAAALGEAGSSVVTSVYGRAGVEIQALMRSLKEGNANEPRISQIGYVSLNEKFPESLARELNTLLAGLLSGEVRTNVTFRKP